MTPGGGPDSWDDHGHRVSWLHLSSPSGTATSQRRWTPPRRISPSNRVRARRGDSATARPKMVQCITDSPADSCFWIDRLRTEMVELLASEIRQSVSGHPDLSS
jgi:hypothetical protein